MKDLDWYNWAIRIFGEFTTNDDTFTEIAKSLEEIYDILHDHPNAEISINIRNNDEWL